MPCMTHPWLPEITNRAGSRNALQCLPGAGRCEDEGGSLTVAMQAACLQVLVCNGNGLPCRA